MLNLSCGRPHGHLIMEVGDFHNKLPSCLAAIFIMNLVYKTKIETSLSALVFIPVILTTYNDLIEIWKSKYSAEERITYEYEEVQ